MECVCTMPASSVGRSDGVIPDIICCKPCLNSFLTRQNAGFCPFNFPIHCYFAANDRKISRVRTYKNSFMSPDQTLLLLIFFNSNNPTENGGGLAEVHDLGL